MCEFKGYSPSDGERVRIVAVTAPIRATLIGVTGVVRWRQFKSGYRTLHMRFDAVLAYGNSAVAALTFGSEGSVTLEACPHGVGGQAGE